MVSSSNFKRTSQLVTEAESLVPQFSIVIPARDEEELLPGCLNSIVQSLARTQCTAEIIVVLNRCSDRTEEIARQAGCRIARDDRKNLAHIRNSGAEAARGEWLVTIDADSRMSLGMLSRISRELSRKEVVGGGVWIVPERLSLGILVSGLILLPLVIRYRIFGGLFFCRRADFAAIGGFDPELSSVEDIDFARRLKAHGAKSGQKFRLLLREYIITSCRKFDRFGDWYFVLRPWLLLRLLKGKSQADADRIWYDFEHHS